MPNHFLQNGPSEMSFEKSSFIILEFLVSHLKKKKELTRGPCQFLLSGQTKKKKLPAHQAVFFPLSKTSKRKKKKKKKK